MEEAIYVYSGGYLQSCKVRIRCFKLAVPRDLGALRQTPGYDPTKSLEKE